MTTAQDRAAMRTRLTQAQDQAREELEAATEALQQAQLRAVAENATIPGHLADAVAEARTRLSNCDGALIAFGRNESDDREAEQRAARAAAEQAVDAAVAEYQSRAEAMITAFEKLMSTGAGAQMREALTVLQRSLVGAYTNVLSEQGWIVSEAMFELRSTEEVDNQARELIRQCLASPDRGPDRAREALHTMCDEIRAHVKAHPANWPTI